MSEITRAGGPGGAVSRACAAAAMLIAPCGAGAQSITDTGDPGEISAPASMSPSTWDYGSAPLQAGINQNKSGKLEVKDGAILKSNGARVGIDEGPSARCCFPARTPNGAWARARWRWASPGAGCWTFPQALAC